MCQFCPEDLAFQVSYFRYFWQLSKGAGDRFYESDLLPVESEFLFPPSIGQERICGPSACSRDMSSKHLLIMRSVYNGLCKLLRFVAFYYLIPLTSYAGITEH